ncbi:uncharacterized protein FIBRA_06822 [Fibroporia radiculosa]|uniref:Cupin type-1 domain-containing protein n=1 Tax=Fibroporia radiculosa TaxID=599839 RepID=J4GCL5_9APHY|nr:uncharacterized protein FIBRA_06822 [Fibroporia radiculosa]CCM04638.1 predicted protein [Fibroporia radiculosa]
MVLSATKSTTKIQSLSSLAIPVDFSDALWPADLSSSDSPLYFQPTTLASKFAMNNASQTPIRETTFLSKAFSGAMHPTRIIPFYYRATGYADESDVTITTLVTANRFKVFRQLVERYQGPISVTIHIPFPAQASLASLPLTHPSVVALQRLHTLYTSSSQFSTYVDVHLALSPFAASAHPDRGHDGEGGDDGEGEGEGEGGRQFNVWRNVARLFARTEFVMMLDVDFAVCTDWRGAVRDAIRRTEATYVMGPRGDHAEDSKQIDLGSAELVRRLREGHAALVVPAFEYMKQEDGVNQINFPTNKEELLHLTRASPPVLTLFHAAWTPGHNSTDYARYYSIPPGSGEVYKVTQYQSAYEPYVIISKRVTWCDERFTGYGANKAACLFEMYLGGVSFYVLADHFLIHQSHTYEEEARREELIPLSALRTSTYYIPAHAHNPNTSLAPHPLLIYHGVFRHTPSISASKIESHLTDIGVVVPHWRYTMYRQSHFHSTTHELLAIASGRARLLFGGEGNPDGMKLEVQKGDVMLLPAGVAHRLLEDLGGEGGAFQMVGCYPVGAKQWDMCYGDGRSGENDKEIRRRIISLPWFDRDPVYGDEGPAIHI